MSAPKKPVKKGGAKKPSGDDDVYLVVLHADNLDALARIRKEYPMDTGPVQVDRESKKVEAHFYITQKQIAGLRKAKIKVDVKENLSENGRERQKEVGKGDRFKGGTVPPRGLGKKPQKK